MTTMREHLAAQLDRKLRTHRLVVWSDPEREYVGVWSSVLPEGVRSEAFEGSWYELRQRIEAAVSGEAPPKLVVYAPVSPPDEDPLAEVRKAAGGFKLRLATLAKQSLKQRLSATRIAKIAGGARTLEQAEAAAEGTGDSDVRLVGVLGVTDPASMLVEVLAGAADAQLDSRGAWGAVADLALYSVGAPGPGVSQAEPGVLFEPDESRERGRGQAQSPDELRRGLFQHLMLCDLDRAAEGALPEELTAVHVRPRAVQQRTACDVLKRLRERPDGLAAYRRLADEIDSRLGLDTGILWWPGLEEAAGTRALEAATFRRSIELLAAGHYADTLRIAERRLAIGPWTPDPLSDWGSRWRASEALARLHNELSNGHPPQDAESSRLLEWYADRGWRVDRAHRRLELACTELRTFGELEGAIVSARAAYELWLEGVLSRFVASVADGVLDIGDLVRQGDVHDRFVGSASGRTAYVWVDALRYELGVELADALRQITDRVEIHPAVAAAPTITQVGMANLLPGASTGLRLSLDGERIAVHVSGVAVDTVTHRCDLLRARHGNVANLDLNDASQKGEKALSNAVGDADLILIRSQEVDVVGESGMLSVAWADFQNVVNLLAGVIARLAQCGVDRVVVSADHGFIALSRHLGPDRTVDAPTGAVGTTKRRVFVGRGGTPNPATARIPLASCGTPGDLDLVVPRGLAVFKAGGGRQFFHGGLSPQELVVPAIVVELVRVPPRQKLEVNVTVAGGRITTGVFAASLSFEGNLFAKEVNVRVVAGRGRGATVARVVSGDGYDPDTGAVMIAANEPRVLTFQVTENLKADTKVELQVFDARTGQKLGSSAVSVASPVVVEDQLD